MTTEERHVPSRRLFLGGALRAAGAVAAGGVGYGVGRAGQDDSAGSSGSVPFYGKHQAGISTRTQDRLVFAAFDVTSTDRNDLMRLLGLWAAAAAQMTQGRLVGNPHPTPAESPDDTGEALGLRPANLTITVGFGPSLFDERFGLASRRPAALAPLPALPGDSLRKELSNGDIGVQACADDPQVAFHAIRMFTRLARGTAVLKWSQLGFGKTASTSSAQQTPRNLFGFKDGTRNIKSDDADALADYVWVGEETDQPWMRGGSYLVTRRIRMLIENWDTDSLGDQERVFGRFKDSGAPLTGTHEFDAPDLSATAHGRPVIDPNAHIRLASPVTNGGVRILRRGYSYTDGLDPATGYLDAGLFFMVYQKNAHEQFVKLQRKLGQRDNLTEYIQHTSSALFACPPGLSGPGDWWGKALFEA